MSTTPKRGPVSIRGRYFPDIAYSARRVVKMLHECGLEATVISVADETRGPNMMREAIALTVDDAQRLAQLLHGESSPPIMDREDRENIDHRPLLGGLGRASHNYDERTPLPPDLKRDKDTKK